MRLYVTLLIATVLALFIWPGERIAIGFVLLSWGWLGLVRGLWMAEHIFYPPAHKPRALSLPGVLAVAGSLQEQKTQAQKALGGFSAYTLIWLGFGALYVLADGDYSLQGLGWPCLIGLCFLLAQSYAHSRSEGAVFAAALSGLFIVMGAVCFIAPSSAPVYPAPAAVLLGLYQAGSLLGGLRRQRYQILCSLGGLAILAVMLGLSLKSGFLFPALLCGWAALGALTVQSRPVGKKKARLRQV